MLAKYVWRYAKFLVPTKPPHVYYNPGVCDSSEFFGQKIQFEAFPLVYLFVDGGQSFLDMSTYIHRCIVHAPP